MMIQKVSVRFKCRESIITSSIGKYIYKNIYKFSFRVRVWVRI